MDRPQRPKNRKAPKHLATADRPAWIPSPTPAPFGLEETTIMNAVIEEEGIQANQVGKSAAIMSILVVISRITGFLRTWAQVFAMGVTVTASCYTVANNLPNQLYELVMGGMLVTAFLPVYLSIKKAKGRKAANLYTSNLVSIVVILMGLVCILGFIFAGEVVLTQSYNANADFDNNLAIYFFKFFTIEILLYSLSTIVSGVLNAERDYVISTAAPIFNNVVVTASFFAYVFLLHINSGLALLCLAIGNPLGVLVQLAVQLPRLKKYNIHLSLHVNLRDPALKETLGIGIPSFIITIVTFITVSVQTSSALSVSVAGASIAYYTRLWYTLPYSILAIPITTAMFTELSECMSNNDMKGYLKGLVMGSSQILFFLIPCATLMVVFARPLIIILAVGKLSNQDLILTIQYLQMLALSLPFFGLFTYLQKVCSSLRKMAVFVIANIFAGGIQVLFCIYVTPVMGLNAVALSSLFYFLVVDIITFMWLKIHFPKLNLLSFMGSIFKSYIFAAIGSALAGLLLGALNLVLRSAANHVAYAFLECLVAGIPSLIIIFMIAVKFKMPEADPIVHFMRKFIKR